MLFTWIYFKLMRTEITNTLLIALIFLLMFGTGEVLLHFFKVKAEITRKFSHMAAGIIAFIIPILLTHHLSVLSLCILFTSMLIITKRLNLLKSIHAIKRKTYGSYLYPLSIYICFLVYTFYNNYIFYLLPILILAISDSFAAIAGKTWPYGRFSKHPDSKTIVGSTMFFSVSLIISLVLFQFLTNMQFMTVLYISVLVSLISTIIESISYRGLDNLSIPVSIEILLILFKDTLISL